MNFTAIIVDSFDEVAPSSSKKFLELLGEYKKENPTVTVISAGRGEGFRNFVITNIGSYEYHHFEPIYLNTDRLIEWRIHDWLMYHLIESGNAMGIPRSMITQGILESVKFDQKVNDLKQIVEAAIDEKPWLLNFMFLLTPSNELLKNIHYSKVPIEEFGKYWADSIIVRSCITHSQPMNLSDSTRFALYKKALKQSANNTMVHLKEVPKGMLGTQLTRKVPLFIVSNIDDVSIEGNDNHQEVKASKIKILERSGFVDIFPTVMSQHAVMFFPPVAQEILADLQ